MNETPARSATPPADKLSDTVPPGLEATGNPPAPATLPQAAAPALASGTEVVPSIAGYAVLAKIGEGGMGAVYLAEDARLGRKAAIKTMRRELAANQTDRDRFVREARAAAAVESDFIVPIWQVGDAADGTPFIAMPFLQGEMLDARLKREPVAGLSLILKVAREVAEGLAAAHAKGLIHRDIKPANIWIEGDLAAKQLNDQIRRCKVLDFGLARSVDKEDAQLTASGAILGTPAYMAPEQARGERVDHRADLFSLGVTLYRMATGTLPFKGHNPMAVLIALATETPKPVRELAPHLPGAVAELIERLMSKDAARRPQAAAEVSAAVREIVKVVQTKKATPAMPVEPSTPAEPVRLLPSPSKPPKTSAELPRVTPVPAPEDEVTEADEPQPSRAKKKRKVPTATAKRTPPRLHIAAGVAAVLALASAAGWLATRGNRHGPGVAKTEDQPKDAPKQAEPKAADPPKSEPGPNKSVQKPEPVQSKAPPVPADADREAAEYVLSIHGMIDVNNDKLNVKTAKELPKDLFRLTGVDLFNNEQVTDAGLIAFKGCKNLMYLNLEGTRVGDAGLGHFEECKNLRMLSLHSTDVSDMGLVHFKGCKNLTWLDLSGTAVSDAGLAHLKDCKHLEKLYLFGTKVSDVGLVQLKQFTKLSGLYLEKTAVTAKGVADFAKALPKCQIVWDGGTIEPKVNLDADRKAAEWVLDAKGSVRVNGTADEIKAKADLPKGPFRLTAVTLTTPTKDADLAAFAGCKNVTDLYLAGTGITNAGLAHFAGCADLKELYLPGTQVDDGSVATIKQFAKLTELSVGQTKLSEKGVKELAAALPGCRIQHDGGTIEPAKK